MSIWYKNINLDQMKLILDIYISYLYVQADKFDFVIYNKSDCRIGQLDKA